LRSFIEDKKTKQYTERLNDLEYLTDKTIHSLENYVKNENDKLITANLNNNQKEAIYTDINELAVYLNMYYDIETVLSDPLISNEYPSGNPFDDVVDVMIYGAIIIRFKYVSRDQSSPQEKLVSYHLMDFKDKKVLGVHIQGDNKFSMYKQWGQGDERPVPIYTDYDNTVIRVGGTAGVGDREDRRDLLY
jgi:hypothetical protein